MDTTKELGRNNTLFLPYIIWATLQEIRERDKYKKTFSVNETNL